MNYKKIATPIVAVCMAFALAGCQPNLRDMKPSEMTIGQQEEVIKTLTQSELELIQNYEVEQTLKAMENVFKEAGKVLTGEKNINEVKDYKNEDLSINEILKRAKASESKK